MKAVYALYTIPKRSSGPLMACAAWAWPRSDIVVMSSEPFEEYEFSHRDKATWLHWIAGVGGVVGLTGGYFLTSATSQAWPIRTSGMPIVATWPNMIVVFELTMLGAILATVLTLFLTAKLGRRLPRFYDPEVSNGYILVGVERPADDLVSRLSAALEAAGDGRVKRLD